MSQENAVSFEEFRELIISSVENEISDSGESSKIVYLREILNYLDGIRSEWGEDPDYYIDDRIQASHYSENRECLDILISDYHGRNQAIITPYTSVGIIRKRFGDAENFIRLSIDGGYTDFEESDELCGFSKSIYEHYKEIQTIRYILITDCPCSPSSCLSDEVINGCTVRYLIWSLETVHKLYNSEKSVIDKLEINFEEDFGERIPCLKVDFGNQDMEYSSYLGFMKGSLLADLYDTYNERLLEGNIRVFLQTTTSVNKGIISTLSSSLEKTRFFAYNNGISATAEEVTISEPDEKGYRWIKKIRGLQIVNGGQTTASIHTARKKDRKNVDGVYVQLKLTVPVNSSGVTALNEKIAQYSNTQNQIKKADFTANDPYQICLEKLSRSVRLPESGMGWFYERIRGQYAESQRLKEFNQKNMKKNQPVISFEAEYPKSRRLTKTDVALHYNAWNQYPHYAAKGGEKNYQKFISLLENSEGEISIHPDERYFRELIAMSILFIRTDTMVNEWQKGGGSTYGNGYKREILLYTLSLLSYLTDGKLNLEKIWAYQSRGITKKTFRLPKVLEQYLLKLIEVAEYHIRHPPSHKSDIREWAKTEDSWRSLKEERSGVKHVPVPEDVIESLYLTDEDLLKREIWLSSLNLKGTNGDIGETCPTEISVISPLPDSRSMKEGTISEVKTVSPPDFRKIIVTSEYSEWNRIISKILEDYEVDNAESTSLETIKKRKRVNLQPLDEDLSIVLAAMSRLFQDSITENDPDFLRIFKIDPELYFPNSFTDIIDVMKKQDDIPKIPFPAGGKFVLQTDVEGQGFLVIKGNKFVVLRGAVIADKLFPDVPVSIITIRQKLERSGKLYRNPKNYNQNILGANQSFTSPDMAASFITGRKIDGSSCWICDSLPLTAYDIQIVKEDKQNS